MDKSKFSNRFTINDIDIVEETVLPENILTNIREEPEISEISNKNLEKEFKKLLLEKIDSTPVWFEYSKNRQKELIKSFIDGKILAENIQISDIDKDLMVDNLINSITNFGAVQDLLDKDNVQAVIINGTKSVHIEINGKILNTEINLSEKQLRFLISSISAMSGIEEFKGIKNFVINNYSISVLGNDICSGTNITIKKQIKLDSDFLIKNGTMSKEIYDFLISAIDMKKNIIISGSINSGKTTLIDALMPNSLKNKRAFLLENESQITTDFNTLVKLKNEAGVIPYVAKSSPEYLVCDLNYIEPEFIDMKGVLLSVRANSADIALQALIGMCVVGGLPAKFAKTKALKNFDYIVQLGKGEDGIIRVTSIIELSPAKTMQASVKTVAKYVDGQYVSEIPQPITSIRSMSNNY